jgi:hypothetical protein
VAVEHRISDGAPHDAGIDSLGDSILQDVAGRVATAIVHTEDWLDDDGHALSQLQRIMLIRTALLSFADFETRLGTQLEAAVAGARLGLRLVDDASVTVERNG